MDIDPKARWHLPSFVARFGGFFPPGDADGRTLVDLEPYDGVRRDLLALLLRGVEARDVPGDFAEVGVYQGHSARLIHSYAPRRTLHLFDTFEGFDPRDVIGDGATAEQLRGTREFVDTSVQAVLARIGEPAETVRVHVGYFPDSVPSVLRREETRFAFVHLDVDLKAPMRAGLEYFWPRLSAGGGTLVMHDYNSWTGAREAIDDFFADKGTIPVPMPDRSGSAVVIKA